MATTEDINLAIDTPACKHLVGGMVGDLDDGYVNLAGRNGARTFIRQCRSIRLWAREFSAQAPDATIGLGALDWQADTASKAST